jgi:undecaprenyl-diphosphatase
MDIFQAVIYGIIQGLGEFLPISSSAHLILAPWLFRWKDPGLSFDVALHLGTLVAVILFFWKDWIRLIKAGITDPKTVDGKLFWFLVVATIPGAIIGKLLETKAESAFRDPLLIGIMMILMGIVLYIADRTKKETNLSEIGFWKSLWIGLSQAVAIIPGVSRSGITMTTGLFLGLTREAVAKFSFLLSTPIILGAGLLSMKDLRLTPAGLVNVEKLTEAPIGMIPFVIGILTAAIVGFLSIKFLLEYLKNKGFGIFVVYRMIVGLLIISVYFLR